MGFDLSGLNPQENTPKPEAITKWYNEDGWVQWKEMKKVEGASVEYFEAHEKWSEENPGDYFRANVWWWRPLWDYVCHVCDDILTEEDMEKGTFNDGHEIDHNKALSIGDRLETFYHDGVILKHQIEREAYLNGLDKEKCTICDGTGQRKIEKESNKPNIIGIDKLLDVDDNNVNFEEKEKVKETIECNGCQGEGKRERWETHYPFEADTVLEFAQFCKQSGGFSIC